MVYYIVNMTHEIMKQVSEMDAAFSGNNGIIGGAGGLDRAPPARRSPETRGACPRRGDLFGDDASFSLASQGRTYQTQPSKTNSAS